MKRYVINLAARPDRLAHMEREFGRFGLTFERFEAVDWRALEARGIHLPRNAIGHIACSYSHLDLLRRIGAGDDPYVAIFEDDVLLSDDAAAFLGDTDWIPPGADLVKLETYATMGYFRRRPASTHAGHTTHEFLHKHTGSAAYIVARDFAADFARDLDPMTARHKIDELLFSPRCWPNPAAKVYQLRPAIAVQEMVLLPEAERQMPSDIGTFTKEFGWRPDPRQQKKYAGPIGRLRMATKGFRDWLKMRMRFVRLAGRYATVAMFMELVPFGTRTAPR
ncbi:glycosyltransferase family 25 protein [Siculibacillus lacustris]|uniref:Glycosyltransferase family 25 protein n=1 Tax=Siculibacillus lacustris TaxID=1549641 RepID=A0A4Q9VRI4_9HYPH|nr:glycosyltransferase family 25 protein [Siculibacillus lacustris]TBW37657.1 glycosyltransferase family 25 protein [Siculibacillus lacustris]